MSTPEQSCDDLAAALAVRRELGPEYEVHLVEGFLDKIDTAIAARVDTQVAKKFAKRKRRGEESQDDDDLAWMVPASLGIAIPLSGVAGGTGGIGGIAVAWVGIVGVNVAYAWGRRARS